MTAQQQRGGRRWYQFTLRSVLLFIALIVLGLVAWRTCIEPYRQERQAMKLIEDLGGRYSTDTRGPAWLTKLFGADYFQAVTFADLADCDEPGRYLPSITRCPWLEVLVIGGDAVGDEEAAALRRVAGLKGLVLDSTRVTDTGVQELQEALPDLTIHKSQRRAIGAMRVIHRRSTYLDTRRRDCPTVFAHVIGEEHLAAAVNITISE